MTVIAISMLMIAIINVVLMGVVVAMLLRVKRLVDDAEGIVKQHGIPLIEKLNGVAEDVRTISKNVRAVEQRVSAITSRVIDQVEPPVRHFAALLAGVRAGVGRLFVAGQQENSDGFAHAHTERSR